MFLKQNPTTNYGNDIKLKAGIGRYRTFINFDLPPLTSSDMVIGAYFYAALLTSNPAPRQVNVHKVNSAWTETGLTWSNMPDVNPNKPDPNTPGYNTKIQDYQLVQNTNTLYGWDITDIVKSWYVDGNKYGIMLKGNDETVGQSEFISSDTTSAYQAGWPQIVIQYTSSAGLEDYWTYHSQSVGRAGTGYVNDYNGNLVFVHNDLSMNGNRMPVTIDHVYNSNQSENIGYGTGWRLNLSQSVEPLDIGTTRYYVYTDEDGTKHYFSQYDSDKYVYIDESGKHLTLTISPDGAYTIKDKFDN